MSIDQFNNGVSTIYFDLIFLLFFEGLFFLMMHVFKDDKLLKAPFF
jgi:uncharacterized membrane protein